ncbi:MAG TPA: S8 family serine peptidase [Rudaea sp.]|jgi:subtilisin family serine protease|nr:S8 family serine peptidase [Rudaea sp.]
MKAKKLLSIVAVAALTITGSLANAADRQTFIVGLQDAPLVEHARQRVETTSSNSRAGSLDGDKSAIRRALQSAESQEYLLQLATKRAQVLTAASNAIGRTLRPRHIFQTTNNGVAVELSDSEAAQVATLPGVVTVRRERVEHALTDAGPQWIGASQLWNGQVAGTAATKGEGVVVGVIDTGINPTHPSFAATDGSGYTNINSRGHFYGLCTTGDATCTSKLIGIYDMTDEGSNGVDTVGHGSHVSGIVAGNAMADALNGMTVSLSRNVSGVAPHANLIMYKACTLKNGTGTCAESDILAAIDQAVTDNVDVINYSIGGDAADAYQMLADTSTDVYAFFQARAAGVVVAAAAGNEGPGPASLDEPGNAPWVIGVANASHNRTFSNSLGSFSGAPDAPSTLVGQGFTAGYGPANIVYAGNYGNALCGVGDTQGTAPTGASNPFAAGTFHGEIVICDRGIYARVEKGYNVKAAGAGGYILANAQTDGESVISDDHYLPAVHLGYNEGAVLKNWVTVPGTHDGTISGVSAVLNDASGDILESDSSRGPYGFSGGILKPDITAPGSNILSSSGTTSGLALLSGTSMATPHVAGSAALVIAVHPTWTPAQVESALLSTASDTIRKDAFTPATPLDEGSGRVRPDLAVKAGLYLPLSAADFRALDPSHGGDLGKLNRVGVESENCLGHCSFTRTVTDMSGGGTWQVSATASTAAIVSVSPTQFTLASGASQTLTIAVDVSAPTLPGTWSGGRIVLHKSTGGQTATDTQLPLEVYSSPGTAPAFQEITASGPGGSKIVQIGGLVALPEATFIPTNLIPATITDLNMSADPTPNDIYTTLPGQGKQFVLFPIEEITGTDFGNHSKIFVVEVTSSNAPVTTLYAGVDSNGDGVPEFAEQQCQSSGSGNAKLRCVVDLRQATASNVWALVDVPQGDQSGNYSVELSSGAPALTYVLGQDLTQVPDLSVTGPGHTAANAAFALRVSWKDPDDEASITPNTPYYGAIMIDATPSGGGGIVGYVPLRIERALGNDDVNDVLEPSSSRYRIVEPGESLTHLFVDVSGTGSLDLHTTLLSGGNSSLNFYVARVDEPPTSAAANVDAAPGASAALKTWTINAASSDQAPSVSVTPGRYYIVAANAGSSEAQFNLQEDLQLSSAIAPANAGSYYNPMRSGHGIFLSQGGGQQVVYWYTYLEDGTPVWYGVQNDAPAAGASAWTGPLFRVTWDGTKVNTRTVIGDAIVTPIDADNLMFSWRMFGLTGSEHFARASGTACVSLNDAQAGLTGQWYAPTQSGYGMDVVTQPSLQFDAFYLYDAIGEPRWLGGSVGAFTPTTTLTMDQISGFCPSCAYVKTNPQPAGTLTTTFTSPTAGSYATNIALLPPLSGSWNINQPMVRLSGSAVCSP